LYFLLVPPLVLNLFAVTHVLEEVVFLTRLGEPSPFTRFCWLPSFSFTLFAGVSSILPEYKVTFLSFPFGHHEFGTKDPLLPPDLGRFVPVSLAVVTCSLSFSYPPSTDLRPSLVNFLGRHFLDQIFQPGLYLTAFVRPPPLSYHENLFSFYPFILPSRTPPSVFCLQDLTSFDEFWRLHPLPACL